MSREKPVRLLDDEVARKIAAGEVIDRPAAIVRELMDNAVDSGADAVNVEIEQGGIDKIRIIDNGSGMTKDDLAMCAQPHSTSKIAAETDLMHLATLGFRGEALSSIASVSRLSIHSGGYLLRVSSTEDHIVEASQPVDGTIVQTLSLFENFPARRQFLKRPQTEGLLCKNIFIEKVLPRPDIAFRLSVDDRQKIVLPKDQSHIRRFVQASGIKESESLFFELHGSSEGMDSEQLVDKKPDWRYSLILGEPSVYRNDRKFLYIYVNGRRITEYSLMQAIEYGCQGYFPNGVHPVAVLFAEMNPSLVDFNIHPAKREARFKDISTLHHNISSTIRQFLKDYTLKTVRNDAEGESDRENSPSLYGQNESRRTEGFSNAVHTDYKDYRSQFFSDKGFISLRNKPSEEATKMRHETKEPQNYDFTHTCSPENLAAAASVEETEEQNEKKPLSFHYIGQTLGVFLIAEKDDVLYLIDQHAAHERILYNRIMECTQDFQKLLVPYVVETISESDDAYLESIKDKLEEAGYTAKNCGEGRWEFSSLPARWKGSETDLTHALLDKRVDPEDIISSLAASSACKAAIKDGYVLDDKTAAQLAEETLNLPDPHCPHGRPIFTAITKKDLFEKVRRT